MTTDLKDILETETEEEAVRKLHKLYNAKGSSASKIAKALGVTDVTIRNWFKKYKLKRKHAGGWYVGKQIKVSEEEYKTLSTRELMKKYDCSQYTIYQLTKKYPSKCGRNKKNIQMKGGKI